MAFCCTRATWKAEQNGLLLHQDHMDGCAERPFVAPGPLGRLCRAAFCFPRATWKVANTALDTTKLLKVRTLLFEENCFIFSDSSSSSIDYTTVGGSWSVQQFYSTPVYPRPSPSNQQLSYFVFLASVQNFLVEPSQQCIFIKGCSR